MMENGKQLKLSEFWRLLEERKRKRYREKRARIVMSVLQELDTARFLKLLNSFAMEKGIKLRKTDFPTIKKWLMSL